MCGFMGLFSSNESYLGKFKEGARRIAVRGSYPTTFHYGLDERYAYARLPTDSIIDKSLAKTGEDLPLLLFNGLITNTAELGDKFNLSEELCLSDHRCLKSGVLEFGDEFLSYCRGMFAFAFVKDDEIVIARDTVGIKPIYYVYDKDIFAFASEIKALQFFGKTVHEVSPGEIVYFSKTGFRLWTDHFFYKVDRCRGLERLLYESVVLPTKRYLKQSLDRDIGILLSGGLDSSILAKLLADNLEPEEFNRIVAFSIGNEGSSDLATATRLAKELKIKHVIVSLPAEEILVAKLEDVIYRAESLESRVIKVALLYEEIAKEIKRNNIDVIIGGEGADELFFGYKRFIEGLMHEQSQELFDDFYKHVFPQTLLQRYDRIFAGNRIEGRVPFLDQAVVEYADCLSAGDKLNNGITKAPLRELAKKLGLPDYIVDREKEKMTNGATGQSNSSANDGFLEYDAQRLCDSSFTEIVGKFYRKHFSSNLSHSYLFTEEDLMRKVELFKKINRGGCL